MLAVHSELIAGSNVTPRHAASHGQVVSVAEGLFSVAIPDNFGSVRTVTQVRVAATPAHEAKHHASIILVSSLPEFPSCARELSQFCVVEIRVEPSQKPSPSGSEFAPVLERNIAALIAHRQKSNRERTTHERIAEAVARFAGSMASVYLHLAVFGGWIISNLPFTPFPKFDPSFVVLAMAASVEAIFLSTFVLITQNRVAADADRRADLDLQISLLAEHEITRLITLVAAIGEKVGVQESRDPALEPLKNDVIPEHVLDCLDAVERERQKAE
jgi:uncharacterized membrane protein